MPAFEGVYNNGKVNVEKLCEKATQNNGTYSAKELAKLFGGKKEVKISEVQQLLKSFQLN